MAKLFNQVAPDFALFGYKDWQQLTIGRRMVMDTDLPIEIVGLAIVRDDYGVALSSRNAYLSDDELVVARTLPRALDEATAAIGRGEAVHTVLADLRLRLVEAGFRQI